MNNIHNITRKNQLHEVMHSDESSSEHGATPKVSFHREDKTSYDWVYSYTGTHPHAPTYIGDNPATFVTDEEHHPSGRNFYYDANGNQIGYAKVSPEERRRSEAQKSRGDKGKGNGKGDVMPVQPENPEDLRTIVWDEENRIVSISDHGKTQRYVYNDRGERVIKEGSEGRTVYVNQYYTVKDGTQTSKHVFAGPNRIATRVTHGDGQDHSHDSHSREQGHEGPEELSIYFYHPDHLGSTGYVTDAKGRLYEHMEYFPFGETWVEEDQGSKLPYLFTSKELDTETGLYYYGARYYDPRTSVWQSADPILDKYLPIGDKENDNALPGFGGVYNANNLGLYTYAHNNPIRYKDPDGRIVGLDNLISAGIGAAVDFGFQVAEAKISGKDFNLDMGRQGTAYVLGAAQVGIIGIIGRGLEGLKLAKEINALRQIAQKAADAADAFKIPLKHLPSAKGNWAKFADSVNPNQLIKEALQSKKANIVPNNKDGSFVVITDLGKVVGTKGETALRVVVGNDGKIWTAFPVKIKK